MDDQRRPGSRHNHSPPPCQAHHGNQTAVDGHNEADRLYKRARVDAIGGLLMRNLYFYVLCFLFLSVANAHSSSQSSTMFAIMSDFGYHPLLAQTWKGNNPCDDKWFGIQCGGEGQILYIFLMSMNLTGTISPRFADLTSLHGIDLSDNLLTGTIPHALTKMKLRVLDVSYNKLHGKISRFGALVLATDGNPGIVMASIVRVPLESGDKETASVVGFFFGILVLGFLFIGGAGVLFYLAKKVNHHI